MRPAAAVDGDPATRWCADGPTSPQWWQVDLGKPEDLTGIRIVWEQDGVEYRYKVEGSDDGKSWTMLSDQTKSDERDQDRTHEFLARGVRYVRVTATGLKDGRLGQHLRGPGLRDEQGAGAGREDDGRAGAAAQAGRQRRPARRDQGARAGSR